MAKTPATTQGNTAASALVKARVLRDCPHGKADDVVEVSPEVAAAGVSDLDAHPDAVAYAESLKAAKPADEPQA